MASEQECTTVFNTVLEFVAERLAEESLNDGWLADVISSGYTGMNDMTADELIEWASEAWGYEFTDEERSAVMEHHQARGE